MNFTTLTVPGMHGAFVQDGFGHAGTAGQDRPPSRHEPLQSMKLAAKDVFDIAGLQTGGGNPAWKADQPGARHTATVVRLLLDQGAHWVGKTVTDELTYSLAGINVHYGTPVNPRDPGRLPGGSSSGSAVAVAGGHADIGLGTDCGGSVRLPASYCGVWGMRPTHGRISSAGCLALAPSFDTVGWFARDGNTLAAVLQVLAHTVVRPLAGPQALTVPADVLGLLDEPVRMAFQATLDRLDARFRLTSLPAGALPVQDWAAAFRTLQAAEVHQQFGHWFGPHAQSFGSDVQQRFLNAARICAAAVHDAQRQRVHACAKLGQTLSAAGQFLILPTAPTVAPRLTDLPGHVDEIRARSQQLLCLAGLAGLPQVTLPWTEIDGAPVGLSVIGARGQDEHVVQVAIEIHASLQASPPSPLESP